MIRSALLLLASLPLALSEKCYGLALEGGGSRGAYEASVIYTLVNNLPPEEVRWNVVTGVSTGALNAGGLSMFPYGHEKEAAQFLMDVWRNIEGNSDIYRDWPLGETEGFLMQSGVYTNAPLIKLVDRLISSRPHRNITVGATNLDTGEFVRFYETFHDIEKAVIASSSAPWFFPTLHTNGTTYSDGGILLNLDIFSAIERCQEIASSDSEITIDMIFLQPPILSASDSEMHWSVGDVENRVDELRKYYNLNWYLLAAQAAHPDINYRFIIKTDRPLPGGIVPLDFDPDNLDGIIKLGNQDAIRALIARNSHEAAFKGARERVLARDFI